MFAEKEMKKEKKKEKKVKEPVRFKKVYEQGVINGVDIWFDTHTGVNYVFVYSSDSAGLSPLLDENGKPIVTPDIK